MPNISVMIKPASSTCNLRCKYCFYCDVAESRDTFNFGLMDNKTMENTIDSALKLADGGSIYFAFQGGEPLFAGIDYFKNFVEYFKKKNTKNSVPYYSLQTNGTLVNKEWAEFFKENNFLIGLSMDGDQTANRFRRTQDGGYSYPIVKENLDLLISYGIEVNILVVATGYISDHIEDVFDFFIKNNYRYLQFIPCLRPFNDKSESELYMNTRQYFIFLDTLFNLYAKEILEKKKFLSIRYFDNLVNMYFGHAPEQCGLLGRCSHQFVIEGNGNVYPCDFYSTDEWLLGNINSSSLLELSHSPKAIRFIQNSLKIEDKCLKCSLFPICRGGGCKRVREDRDYCDAYKVFFFKNSQVFPKFKDIVIDNRNK